jgi:hypothetical protein
MIGTLQPDNQLATGSWQLTCIQGPTLFAHLNIKAPVFFQKNTGHRAEKERPIAICFLTA